MVDWAVVISLFISAIVLAYSVYVNQKTFGMQKREKQPYFERKGVELEGFIDTSKKSNGFEPCNIKLNVKNTGGRIGAISKISILIYYYRYYYFDEYIETDFKKIRPNTTSTYEFKKTYDSESIFDDIYYTGILKKGLTKKERVEVKINNGNLIRRKKKEYGFGGIKQTISMKFQTFGCLVKIEYYDYEDLVENKSTNSDKIVLNDLKTIKYENYFDTIIEFGSKETNIRFKKIRRRIFDAFDKRF